MSVILSLFTVVALCGWLFVAIKDKSMIAQTVAAAGALIPASIVAWGFLLLLPAASAVIQSWTQVFTLK